MRFLVLILALVSVGGVLIAWPIGIWLGWRATARVAPGRCGVCEYDRVGTGEVEVCPECGVHPHEAARRVAPGAARGSLIRISLLMVGAVSTLVIMTFRIDGVVMASVLVAAMALYTGSAMAFLIRFAMRISRRRRIMLLAGVLASYAAGVALVGVWHVLQTLPMPLLEVAGLVHVLAMGVIGWVVLLAGGAAMQERVTGAIEHVTGTESSEA